MRRLSIGDASPCTGVNGEGVNHGLGVNEAGVNGRPAREVQYYDLTSSPEARGGCASPVRGGLADERSAGCDPVSAATTPPACALAPTRLALGRAKRPDSAAARRAKRRVAPRSRSPEGPSTFLPGTALQFVLPDQRARSPRGASAVHSGASAIHSGASTIHSGASNIHIGASAIHSGASAIHSGASAIHKGASGAGSAPRFQFVRESDSPSAGCALHTVERASNPAAETDENAAGNATPPLMERLRLRQGRQWD